MISPRNSAIAAGPPGKARLMSIQAMKIVKKTQSITELLKRSDTRPLTAFIKRNMADLSSCSYRQRCRVAMGLLQLQALKFPITIKALELLNVE
jgi:hypothetical protein